MAIILIGGTSGASVDSDATPRALRNILYDANGNVLSRQDQSTLPNPASGIPMLGKNRNTIARIPRTGMIGSLGILDDEWLLYDPIEGAAVNTNIWTQSTSTMTIAQATHAITLNSGAGTTTAGAFAIHTSNRQFLKVPGSPIAFRARLRHNWFANSVGEWGFGAPSGVTAVVNDGAFFRKTTAGQLQAVVSFNGTETTQNLGAINTTDFYFYEVMVEDDFVHFVVIDSTGTIVSDVIQNIGVSTQAFILSVTHIAAFFRNYNNTAPATAPTVVIGAVSVMNRDIASNKSWGEQLASLTKNAITSPTTFAQLANWTNSTAPASATLSNTAAGYTTLGGLWQFAAVAGTATDFALFGFTNPTPYQLAITAIKIDTVVTGAAIATTATILQWGVAVNSSAVSLATAGTYPPMRVAIGVQGFIVGNAIGTSPPTVIYTPGTPLIVEPGRFLHIILTIPVGTATAAQVIRGTCMIDGHFE
jgi:hypothetical protein